MENDVFLTWVEREICEAEGLYNESTSAKKRQNLNARLLALKESRNKYLMTRPE